MGLGRVGQQTRLRNSNGLVRRDIRQLAVVLDLVLQAGERLEDLLALVRGLGVLRGRDGPVDVVDGAGLGMSAEKRPPQSWAERFEALTMMMGHRSRAEVEAKDVLSPVE